MASSNQYKKKHNPVRFLQGHVMFGIIYCMDFAQCVMLKMILINTTFGHSIVPIPQVEDRNHLHPKNVMFYNSLLFVTSGDRCNL
jgi:hypothetical protein